MSSTRALDLDCLLFAKMRDGSEAQTSEAGQSGCLGLLRSQTRLALEGRGGATRVWGYIQGTSFALCSPPHSLFRKVYSSRNAWRCDLSGWWHFYISSPLWKLLKLPNILIILFVAVLVAVQAFL